MCLLDDFILIMGLIKILAWALVSNPGTQMCLDTGLVIDLGERFMTI